MRPLSERALEEYTRLKQRSPRILVIDDKLDTLLLLRELLSSRGYEVQSTTEPQEAKELVHS
jgi:CheY-like chemotaxis protein